MVAEIQVINWAGASTLSQTVTRQLGTAAAAPAVTALFLAHCWPEWSLGPGLASWLNINIEESGWWRLVGLKC